jgi:predicted glycogen debranching enzyme
MIAFGRQVCGNLDAAASREWLVTDGLGGYAMGTVAGLRTRRYHGLLVVAEPGASARRLGLAALDPVVRIGDRRIRLATDEWVSGVVDPAGYRHLASFTLDRGVPRWRWDLGEVQLEREVAMAHGHPTVGVVFRLVRAPDPVTLEVTPLCTWRDVHGERHAWGEPSVTAVTDGFVFEDAFRVSGPGWRPGGDWYLGLVAREEAARGLNAAEDLWAAGRFVVQVEPGATVGVSAAAGSFDRALPSAEQLVRDARRRANDVAAGAQPADAVDGQLALAADQFVIATPTGPSVVAGYPWFGEWSRDLMTASTVCFWKPTAMARPATCCSGPERPSRTACSPTPRTRALWSTTRPTPRCGSSTPSAATPRSPPTSTPSPSSRTPWTRCSTVTCAGPATAYVQIRATVSCSRATKASR